VAGPEQLLDHPATRLVSPWCVTLDNLELAIVLVTQPMLSEARRRSEIEATLRELSASMPIGEVYFQRVARAVEKLEAARILHGDKAEKGKRRFRCTAEGFASLVVNLRVLNADPTLNGDEFEFKKEIVAMWHMLIERAKDADSVLALSDETAAFWEAVEKVTLGAQPVFTSELFSDTFNIQRLIERQRQAIRERRTAQQQRLAEVRVQTAFWQTADLRSLAAETPGLRVSPELLEGIRALAMSNAMQVAAEATLLRYEAYLRYLDQLEKLYQPQFKELALEDFRRLSKGA
jgi:hypothetical protein